LEEYHVAKKYISNKDESVRIFKSDFLEAFTHVHPAVPHVLFAPVIAFTLYQSYARGLGAGAIALTFVTGVLVWTVAEYFVHRYVFHATPQIEEEVRDIVTSLAPGEPAFSKIPGVRRKHYFLAHGVHHDFPNDSRRLVMPPSLSIPLAAVYYILFMFTVGATYGPAGFAGLVFGYLVYDTVHYAVHHYNLRSPVLLYLKKHHFRHHYQDSTQDYGVSSPLWDLILGTWDEKIRQRRKSAVP
jgi:sterol desaturase/sphingolipid hydroxylase (fatty acid hydroxylase superfamily)